MTRLVLPALLYWEVGPTVAAHELKERGKRARYDYWNSTWVQKGGRPEGPQTSGQHDEDSGEWQVTSDVFEHDLSGRSVLLSSNGLQCVRLQDYLIAGNDTSSNHEAWIVLKQQFLHSSIPICPLAFWPLRSQVWSFSIRSSQFNEGESWSSSQKRMSVAQSSKILLNRLGTASRMIRKITPR